MELTARAAKSEEADRMLALMCRAFHMDPVSARRIFYADPFYDLSLKRVLVTADDEIVSCLTLIPSGVYLGNGVSLPICGVAGVCTDSRRRNRGYASELIRSTMSQVAEEQRSAGKRPFACAALTAALPSLYRSLGWANCGDADEVTLPASSLHFLRDSHTDVRLLTEAELPRYAPVIHKLYDANRGEAVSGAFQRDERRWRCIQQSGARRFALCFADGQPSGYAAYALAPKDSTQAGEKVNLHELITSNSADRDSLLGALAALPRCSAVQGVFSPTDAAQLRANNDAGTTSRQAFSVLFRIVNLAETLAGVCDSLGQPQLRALAPARLLVEIADHSNDQPEAALIEIAPAQVSVATVDTNRPIKTALRLRGSRGAITQLALGYRSASELVSYGELSLQPQEGSSFSGSALELCAALFPKREVFLAPLDQF